MKRTIKLPSVQNVAAGATCNLDCSVGLTYDFIDMVLTNITLAQLTNIKVNINGKTIQEFASGTELDNINKFHGRTAFQNSVLRLWFMRPELKDARERYMTSLGTADVQTFSISADIDGACVSPALVMYAQQGAATPFGAVTKVKAFPRTFATSGKQDIDTLPRSGARIACIHLFKSDISYVEMEVDGRKAVDVSKAVMQEIQTDFGKVPVTASATHIDFLVNGLLKDALRTDGVQDMRVQPTLDTSGAVRTVVEYIDGFEGI